MKHVTVAATKARQDQVAAFDDPIWALLQTATEADVDAWLADNVKGVADVRPVLRSIIVALRFFMQQQQAGAL